jgi:eukaryotic-like serine/threonine-protein kinase
MSPEKIGRYEIVAELGRGAMGVVYKATDPNIGRLVALKTMRLDVHGIEHAEMSRRFRHEARAAGTLNHPNIVTIYDAHEVDGLFYIAMEYIEGETLQGLMVERKALSTEKVIGYTKQICAGLDYAHGKGIIHRDIKPANIMITSHETVKIMDFGIAKTGAGLTSDGRVLGTPSYMSPEQVRGRPIDGCSDLFGLGVMLYEMVTGEKPFTGESITTIIYKIVNEQPIAPKDLDATVHPGLSAVILKSLAKAPEQRYQTGAELAKDLDSYKSFPEGATRTFSGTSTAPVPFGTALPSVGTEAIYSAETVAVRPRPLGQSADVEAKAKVPAAAQEPHASINIPPAQGRAERARRSGSRRRLPVVIVLLLVIAGVFGYRAKHEKVRVAEVPVPPPPAPVVSQDERSTEQTEKPNQKQKSDQTADAIQAMVNDQLRKAGINPQNPTDVSGLFGKHPNVSTKSSSGTHPDSVSGRLNINSTPPGARIEIDGSDSGEVTPAVINTGKGEHRIVLRFPGFKPASVLAKVEEGKPFNYAPRLTPLGVPESFSRFSGMPDIAAIQRQAQEQARQAQRFRQLRNKGMLAGFGMLNISTDPPGALVSINGRNRNKVTPLHSPFPAGDWELTLTLKGYKPLKRALHVEDGKVTAIQETLVPQ